MRSKNENIHVAKVNASRSTEDIGPCDLVIVAVKTTANRELPPLIAPLLGEKTMILTLQNGLGNEEFLAEHFGAGADPRRPLFHLPQPDRTGRDRAFQDNGRLTIGEFRGIPTRACTILPGNSSAAGSFAASTADLALAALAQARLEHSLQRPFRCRRWHRYRAILADDGLRQLAL